MSTTIGWGQVTASLPAYIQQKFYYRRDEREE